MLDFLQSPSLIPTVGGLLGGLFIASFFFRLHLGRLQEKDKAAQQTITEIRASESNLKADLYDLRATESSLLKRQADLEARLKSMLQADQEKQPLTEKLTEIIRSQNQESRHASEAILIKEIRPLNDLLAQFQTRIAELDQTHRATTADLKTQIQALAQNLAAFQISIPESDQPAPAPLTPKVQVPEEKLFEGFMVEESNQKAENAANDLRAALNFDPS